MQSIVHLINDEALGGVNRMLAEQTRALAGQFDIDVQVVAPRRPLPPRVAANVAIVHFTASWSKLPFLTLLRAQRGEAPVVIVEHTFTGGFETHCVSSRGRFRRMLRLAYSLADKVVAVSHGQARWMLDAELVAADKLMVIEPSVDLSALALLPARPAVRSGPLRLAAYGRYCRQKGFDVLVEAFREVPPDVAVLTLAGYGPDEDALRRAARGLSHVAVGGPVDDLGRFLGQHDAVVVPSRWEAFGLVALEARAAGLPVIASDADGLSEQVAPGHGLLVAAEDPRSLAGAIRTLAGCDRTTMGAMARRSAHGHFDRHVAAWSDLITGLGTRPGLTAAAA